MAGAINRAVAPHPDHPRRGWAWALGVAQDELRTMARVEYAKTPQAVSGSVGT